MKKVKFRKFKTDIEITEPIITGRVPSGWLYWNTHRISEEDFYNENLTEQDLKDEYEDDQIINKVLDKE